MFVKRWFRRLVFAVSPSFGEQSIRDKGEVRPS